MSEGDIEYFLHRSEVEFEAAHRAIAPEVAATHKKLAEAYLKRVADLSPTDDELEAARAEKCIPDPHSDDEQAAAQV